MPISRRAFVQGLTALMGSAAAPAFARQREPFVRNGEHVSSIVWHMWGKPLAPTRPLVVHEIGTWDGTGYPITLRQFNYGRPPTLYDGWYDFEWSNLHRDVPPRFWAIPGNVERYPNVHSYVREQRFGESPDVMRLTMERNRRNGPPLGRPVVVGRRVAA